MQQTLKQYDIDRRANQVQSSQQEPEKLDSRNLQSSGAAENESRNPQSPSCNPSASQERQRLDDGHNVSSPHAPPYSQQGVRYVSYAAPSTLAPRVSTSYVGTQTDGFLAASASSVSRDPPTNAHSP